MEISAEASALVLVSCGVERGLAGEELTAELPAPAAAADLLGGAAETGVSSFSISARRECSAVSLGVFAAIPETAAGAGVGFFAAADLAGLSLHRSKSITSSCPD